MNAPVISWDTAPEYKFKGFTDMPHIEEVKNEKDEVIGKRVWHDIYRNHDVSHAESRGGYCRPAMSTNQTPERFMTEAEFHKFVNYMERVTE